MKLMKNIRRTLLAIAFLASFTAFSCGQQQFFYNDYIYGINNFVTVSQVNLIPSNGLNTQYTV